MSASAIKKPMLAGKCDCPEALSFPVLATPKLDGIRCLKIAGQALTRSDVQTFTFCNFTSQCL